MWQGRLKTKNSTFASTVKQVRGTYDELAEEYYDRGRHPTCANFRDACALIYQQWLPQCWPQHRWICETGAGRSLVAEIAVERQLDTGGLILVDSAPHMLAHSVEAIRAGCNAILADALQLPFVDSSISVLIATLGDPYNTPRFWREVVRVLAKNGFVIFTTPSYAWSSTFRRTEKDEQDVAEFELRDGRRILVPSLIFPEAEQVALLAAYGLLVRKTIRVTVDQLQAEQMSSKLRCAVHGEIVTGYWAALN